MFKSILLSLFVVSLMASPIAFAKKDKDNKGPNDMAYEKSNEKSFLNREEDMGKGKQKKEKAKKEKSKKEKSKKTK